MKLRKFVLTSCILLSTTLFICGIVMLGFTNSASRKRNMENKHSASPERITSEGPGQPNVQSNPPAPENVKVNLMNPVNLVVFGLDDEQVRSDVIILFNFDPNSGNINILSFARDTRVRVGGGSSKINALIGMGREKLAINKLEELTGLRVDYYLTMNFKGFRKIIDVLDGVEINVPITMDYDDPDQNLHIHLRKGLQTLNGAKAEQFVRYRKGNEPGEGYIDGDIGRIKMQQEFVKALIQQKFKFKYLSKADDIFLIMKMYFKTNIEISDVDYYLKSIMNMNYSEVKTFTLPGESAYVDDLWYFICDRKKTMQLIEKNFYK